ncbi:hypothetical protein EVAR_7496_1 [Eumeta japonica]|uniref:Uncharacterized protein n=1 Tax=Eumeta variegata TaxID=151549 RepID=A0A4C1Y6N4_EUMVA|nr:hypothetical protein EVAR_7496_1 [Eumeta japonica]
MKQRLLQLNLFLSEWKGRVPSLLCLSLSLLGGLTMPEWKGRVPLTRSHCERITVLRPAPAPRRIANAAVGHRSGNKSSGILFGRGAYTQRAPSHTNRGRTTSDFLLQFMRLVLQTYRLNNLRHTFRNKAGFGLEVLPAKSQLSNYAARNFESEPSQLRTPFFKRSRRDIVRYSYELRPERLTFSCPIML